MPDASDQELEELLNECRVSIAPLRYGAGVKGKVVEAMRHGLPVVGTSVAAEGIPEGDGAAMVANTAAEFASAVLVLCESEALASLASDRSIRLIRDHFSRDLALAKLSDAISP